MNPLVSCQTVHGPRERDRHIFPGTTLDNLLTGRCTSREFAGKTNQSPACERLQLPHPIDLRSAAG